MKQDELRARFAGRARAPAEPPTRHDTSQLEVAPELVTIVAENAGVTEVEAREALWVMARSQGGKFHVSMSESGAVTFGQSAPEPPPEPPKAVPRRCSMEAWEGWSEWSNRVFPYATEPDEVEALVRGIARAYAVHWSDVVNKLEELKGPLTTYVGVDVAGPLSTDGSVAVVMTRDANGRMEVKELMDLSKVGSRVDMEKWARAAGLGPAPGDAFWASDRTLAEMGAFLPLDKEITMGGGLPRRPIKR